MFGIEADARRGGFALALVLLRSKSLRGAREPILCLATRIFQHISVADWLEGHWQSESRALGERVRSFLLLVRVG